MPLNDVPLPGPNSTLQNTQNPIRQNFLDINTGFSVDHESFNTTNAGFHNKVTMQKLPVPQTPIPAGAANTAVIYYADFGGINEVFLNTEAGTPIPITAAVNASSGYSYLPSGIILQWGLTAALPSNNTITTNFTLTFPNNIFQVQVSLLYAVNGATPPSIYVRTLNVGNFVAYVNGVPPVGMVAQYFAIGN